MLYSLFPAESDQKKTCEFYRASVPSTLPQVGTGSFTLHSHCTVELQHFSDTETIFLGMSIVMRFCMQIVKFRCVDT